MHEHVPGSRLSHDTGQLKQIQSKLGGLGDIPTTKLWVLRANNSNTRDNSIWSKQRNKIGLDFRAPTWGGHRDMRHCTWNVRALLGNTQRMKGDRLSKQLYEARMRHDPHDVVCTGRRSRGRRRATWRTMWDVLCSGWECSGMRPRL